MRNVLFAFALFISSFSSAFSQITFERNYDTLGFYYANCVRQTLDGGYVFCGSSYSSATANDAEIVKTDEYGNVLWAKKYGGPAIDGAITIEVTADSNYFVFGIKDQVSATQSDIWILKLDNIGDTIFAKNLDLGSGSNFVKGSTKTFDGGFALTGFTNSRGQGLNDVSLIKLNSTGDTSWIKTYGGTNSDGGYSVAQTSDSGFILAGRTGSFNVQSEDFYVIRTDFRGDTLWTRTFGFSNVDLAASAKETPEGGFIVVGSSWDTIAGHNDFYLVKYDRFGNLLWNKRLKQNVENTASSITVLADGRFVICGTIVNSGTLSDFYLVETDSNGDTLWTKTFTYPNRDESAFDLATTNDGGFIIVGTTAYNMSTQAYVVKTDSSGSIINSVTFINPTLNVTLYPNPTVDNINIEIKSKNEYTNIKFEILNLTGSLVKVGEIKTELSNIELTGLSAGIYFLKLSDNENSLRAIKFIINH